MPQSFIKFKTTNVHILLHGKQANNRELSYMYLYNFNFFSLAAFNKKKRQRNLKYFVSTAESNSKLEAQKESFQLNRTFRLVNFILSVKQWNCKDETWKKLNANPPVKKLNLTFRESPHCIICILIYFPFTLARFSSFFFCRSCSALFYIPLLRPCKFGRGD